MKKVIVLISLLLTSCSSQQEKNNRAFFGPEVGIYSDIAQPDFVSVQYPKRFENFGSLEGRPPEESIAEEYGNRKYFESVCDTHINSTVKTAFDEACKKIDDGRLIINNFTFGFDAGLERLFVTREAIMLTQSKLKPIALFRYSINTDAKNAQQANAKAQKIFDDLKNNQQEKLFQNFVSRIKFDKDFVPEEEWIPYENSKLGIKFKLPSDLGTVHYKDDTVSIWDRFIINVSKSDLTKQFQEPNYACVGFQAEDIKIGQYDAKRYKCISSFPGGTYVREDGFDAVFSVNGKYFHINYDYVFAGIEDSNGENIAQKILNNIQVTRSEMYD